MRITIGGVLVVGGVAVIALMGPLGNLGDTVKQAFDGVTSLASSVSAPSLPLPSVTPSGNPVAATSVVTASSPTVVQSAPVSTVKSVPVVPAQPAVVATPTPTPAPTVEPAAPTKTKRHRSRKLKTAESKEPITLSLSNSKKRHIAQKTAPKTSPLPPTSAANAKPAISSSDPLMGHYVSVKLKTGREVKGVLREKTAQGITLEIPGMGPFQYPNTNIDGLKSAD